MNKDLSEFRLSLAEAEKGLPAFRTMLDDDKELSEGKHVLPFFEEHPHLAVLMGAFNTQLEDLDRACGEFNLFGNFRCDWAVGDSRKRAYTLIEFEDGRADSVFRPGKKYNDEWGTRLEHGFSQLVDWFWSLDAWRHTPEFERKFGAGDVKFYGMLVIGRSRFISDDQRSRMHWRRQKVLINSEKITCITFDQLYEFLKGRIASVRRIANQGDLL